MKPYSNSKNAFEIFGCDFMIDSNYNVFLLEINDHISYKFKNYDNPDVINFQKKVCVWVYNNTIKKIFNK